MSEKKADETKTLVAIVDDDRSVCWAIKRLVISLDMNAETFCSGQEFLDFMEATPPSRVDCAILDVEMPGLSGLEVQKRLAGTHRALPVIVITGHETPDRRELALAAGAVAFLCKPFNYEALVSAIEMAIERRSQMRPV